jgi:hypothetical protein
VNSRLSVCGLSVDNFFYTNADTCELHFRHFLRPLQRVGWLVFGGSTEDVVEQYLFSALYVRCVLATGSKVRGFKPGRGRWILRVIKSAARLPSEGK